MRHDSEIAYEQQQEATRLKKKGQQKLAHTLEHIAFEKTEQVSVSPARSPHACLHVCVHVCTQVCTLAHIVSVAVAQLLY